MTEEWNWAGNYQYGAARLHCPETVTQVQELAAGCRRLKALGTRHSFNSIADTPEDLVSLAKLDRVVEVDTTRRTVTVEAGIRYGTLCQYLSREGLTLHNLASLPHISVGGACATGTHGSGIGNGSLAAAVSALEMVTAEGAVRTISREQDADTFAGMVVALGALGLITKLTLDVVPAFTMRQDLYENLPLAQVETDFETIMGSAYSVSLFTDWRNPNFTQVWRKSRAEEGDTSAAEPEFYGAVRAPRPLHPIAGISAENCTPQMGIVGASYERLPHFRMEYLPSAGEELQSEYLLPRHLASAALRAVYEMRDRIAPLLLISEVRTVAADDLWLSPCYRQDSVALHFTWQKDEPAVRTLLPALEACLAPFQARPHWGKLFALRASEMPALYPRLPDFLNLAMELDPQGKFRNAFLEEKIFGAA